MPENENETHKTIEDGEPVGLEPNAPSGVTSCPNPVVDTNQSTEAVSESPLAGSREAVRLLINKNYEALYLIALNQCRPENVELKHVSGFNAGDVTQEVCLRLDKNWRWVPQEPGFFGFAKAVAHNHCSDLWAKHQRRARAFNNYQKEGGT